MKHYFSRSEFSTNQVCWWGLIDGTEWNKAEWNQGLNHRTTEWNTILNQGVQLTIALRI